MCIPFVDERVVRQSTRQDPERPSAGPPRPIHGGGARRQQAPGAAAHLLAVQRVALGQVLRGGRGQCVRIIQQQAGGSRAKVTLLRHTSRPCAARRQRRPAAGRLGERASRWRPAVRASASAPAPRRPWPRCGSGGTRTPRRSTVTRGGSAACSGRLGAAGVSSRGEGGEVHQRGPGRRCRAPLRQQ